MRSTLKIACVAICVSASLPAPQPALTAPADAPTSIALSLAESIEQLMPDILSARGWLPGRAIEIALRAYEVYKTYRNGQKVEEVRKTVFSILTIVTEMKLEQEHGHRVTHREMQLTRDLLEAHASQLDLLSGRLKAIEDAAADLKSRVLRRGCGEMHAWRKGRCVDVTLYPR